MKFKISRTSIRRAEVEQEFETLEQFVQWLRGLKEPVILSIEENPDVVELEIYDDYRE